MKSLILFPLNTTPEQLQRLVALQLAFSQVCNAISPVAQANHCWNRVALHHLVYKAMREQFPNVGSQMICNAIYSVCRTYRTWAAIVKAGIHKGNDKQLPKLVFLPTAPVFFDRHTLSIKDGRLSMFTLDGRMQFAFDLNKAKQEHFASAKIKEIALVRKPNNFELQFSFVDFEDVQKIDQKLLQEMPEYVLVTPVEPVLEKVA